MRVPFPCSPSRAALGALVLAACSGSPPELGLLETGSFTRTQSAASAASYRPSPSLTPSEVVRIQLTALQTNDEMRGDPGIATVFQFASPANRAITGPLDRFVDLVKTPEYRPMLNHRAAEPGPLVTTGDLAEQRVMITSAAGERISYVFVLSRQRTGAYAGCWMTEGVLREAESDRDPPWDVKRV